MTLEQINSNQMLKLNIKQNLLEFHLKSVLKCLCNEIHFSATNPINVKLRDAYSKLEGALMQVSSRNASSKNRMMVLKPILKNLLC